MTEWTSCPKALEIMALTVFGNWSENYSVETLELLANIYADFPRHISYISVHNKTVNIEGKSGHGKPIDLMMEHYNL